MKGLEGLVQRHAYQTVDYDPFRQMLEDFVPRTGYVPSGDRTRIVNLGCGAAVETRSLREYFGNGNASSVNMLGIDLDHRSIEIAKIIHGNASRFVLGDASELERHTDHEFDVALARHPKTTLPGTRTGEIADWGGILKSAYSTTRSGGLLVSTTYFDNEAKRFRELAIDAGWQVKLTEPNPHSIRGLDKYTVTALK